MRSEFMLALTMGVVLLSCTTLLQVACETATPKLVIVLHTPGEGSFWPSPAQNIPKSPKVLRPTGVRQMYLLGSELRARYAEPLKITTFDADKIFSYSYDDFENLQSSQSFLSGFYPVGSATEINHSYPLSKAVPPFNHTWNTAGYEALPHNFQIVPVHSNDTRHEQWLRSFDDPVCPLIKRTNKTTANETYNEILKQFKPLIDEIMQHWKITQTPSLGDLQDILDNMINNYTKGVNPWESKKEKLRALDSIIRMYLRFDDHEYNRIYITPLFREFRRFMHSSVYDPKSQIKFIEYSGSESTIDLVISVLNITSFKCMHDNYPKGNYPADCPFAPGRGSFILLELQHLSESNKHVVKLSYDDKSYPFPNTNGVHELEYDKFEDYLLSFTNRTDFNYTEKCGVIFEEDIYPTEEVSIGPSGLQVFLLIILILIGLLTAYFAFRNYRAVYDESYEEDDIRDQSPAVYHSLEHN